MSKVRYLLFCIGVTLFLSLSACGEKETVSKNAEPEPGVFRFEAGFVSSFSSYIPDKDDIYDPIGRTEFCYEKDRFYVVEHPVEKGSDLDVVWHLNTEEKVLSEYMISELQWEVFPYSNREWDQMFWLPVADVPEEFLSVSEPLNGKSPIMLSVGKKAALICRGETLYYLEVYDAPASDPADQYISLLYRLERK